MNEISESSKEQAAGLNEINEAVNQLDQVTQQNAAMFEQTTAASHALTREAETLSQTMGRFRTGGAQDEAAAASVIAPAAFASGRVPDDQPAAADRPTAGKNALVSAAALARKPEATPGPDEDWNDF